MTMTYFVNSGDPFTDNGLRLANGLAKAT